MSPTNSPQHSPCGSSPTQPGMSPVKSPVTSLPPLHGSLTLNVAKRRKVDDALSPRDSRRAVSGSLGATTPASLGAQPSLVTPSKRSVSTPVRLLTPRGGRRTPSLADRPIPVLMPQDEEPEEEATRSRRASYASLYQMDKEEDKEDKEEVTGQEETKEDETELSESKHTSHSIESATTTTESTTTKGKELDDEAADSVDSPEASVSPVESSSSVIEVVATSTESLVNEAVGHVPAHSVLPPPSQMEPPSSPKKK